MSTTTGGKLNLVKPELTDDHKVTIGTDLPENFQKIDDELSELLAGGEIYTATLENNWTGTLYCRKNGLNQVAIYGDLTVGTVAEMTRITTLPDEYKPIEHTVCVVYGTSGTITRKGLVSLVINRDNGYVVVIADSRLVEGATIRINQIYQAG